MKQRPVVLMILDGYGISDHTEGNAIYTAKTPVMTFDNGTATVNTDTCKLLGLDYETVKEAFTPYCLRVQEITTAESFN